MKTILLYTTLVVSTLNAQTFELSYTFDSVRTSTGTTDPTPIINPPGILGGPFSAHGVSSNPNATGRFSFTGWPLGGVSGTTSYSSLIGKLDTGKYFEVSLEPLTGFLLNLDSVSFLFQRSGTGIRTISVRSNEDNFTNNLVTSVNPSNPDLTVEPGNIIFLNKDIISMQTGSTIKAGGPLFTSSFKPITFRFYGYNATGGTGTFSLDEVDIFGSSSLVPTGMADEQGKDMRVYPDPSTTGVFYLEKGELTQVCDAAIYSLSGKKILDVVFPSTGRLEVNLASEQSGIYLLHVSWPGSYSVYKLCLMH